MLSDEYWNTVSRVQNTVCIFSHGRCMDIWGRYSVKCRWTISLCGHVTWSVCACWIFVWGSRGLQPLPCWNSHWPKEVREMASFGGGWRIYCWSDGWKERVLQLNRWWLLVTCMVHNIFWSEFIFKIVYFAARQLYCFHIVLFFRPLALYSAESLSWEEYNGNKAY